LFNDGVVQVKKDATKHPVTNCVVASSGIPFRVGHLGLISDSWRVLRANGHYCTVYLQTDLRVMSVFCCWRWTIRYDIDTDVDWKLPTSR